MEEEREYLGSHSFAGDTKCLLPLVWAVLDEQEEGTDSAVSFNHQSPFNSTQKSQLATYKLLHTKLPVFTHLLKSCQKSLQLVDLMVSVISKTKLRHYISTLWTTIHCAHTA